MRNSGYAMGVTAIGVAAMAIAAMAVGETFHAIARKETDG
jgi:hypothetical protein